MADESTWAPAPRQGGRRIDWNTGASPSAGAFSAAPAPFQEEQGLDDLFDDGGAVPGTVGWAAAPAESPASDGLDDLFDDDAAPVAAVPAQPLGGELDDLFDDEPAPLPAQEVPASGGLDDLFDDGEEAPEAPEVAPETHETPEPVAALEEAVEIPAQAEEAPAGDVWGAIPLPVEDAEESAPEIEEFPSLTSLAGLTQRQAPSSDPVKATPDAEPAKTAKADSRADTAEEPSKKSRLDLVGRRKAVEEASMGVEQGLVVRDQVQMLEKYVVPAHIWSYVDRLLGYVSSAPQVQAVVNPFILTRDRILDAEQRRRMEEVIAPRMMDAGIQLHNPRDAQSTFDLAYDELIGISVLGPLWRDNEITEIMVDGWDRIVIERNGRLMDTPLKFRDAQHAARVARDLAAKVSDRALTPTNPLVTAQLPGARVTFAYGSVVKSGLSISLRKFVDLLGMEKLLEYGALNPEMAEFLKQTVVARANVLVSGGTGTGKTTQINSLSQFIPDHERVITIEDAFELQLSNSHVVALQTKEKASADDEVIVTQDMLLVNTLRMRPDRVIVGEIREGKGAVVMLQAANTGHDGTMTTIHAQSSEVALNERLADLVMEVTSSPSDVVRRSVASAIDLVVQVTRKHGRRFISEISVVDRSSFKNGTIVPEPVFVGDVSSEGEVTFRHVGGVRPETGLGMKLAEVGFNISQWEPSA